MLDSSPKGGVVPSGDAEQGILHGHRMEIRSDSYTAIAIDLDGDVLYPRQSRKDSRL
jgi:hypothetical protein